MARNQFVYLCVLVATVILLATGIVMSTAPAAAQALMSESEARQKLKAEFGVDVLRITAGQRDGVPVFVVRVMNPGGNFNSAFRVSVLEIDRRTGKLVLQFQQGASGVTGQPGVRNDTPDNSGPVLRRESVQ